MDPIEPGERLVVNRFDAEYEPFVGADGQPTGESALQLDRSQPLGVGFHVYRMEPGTSTIPHEHTCDEQFLILEGELTDHDGYVYRAGDMVLLRKGTVHNSYTEHGCVAAVFIATAERNL